MRRITDFLKGKMLLLLIAAWIVFTGFMWSMGTIHERYLIAHYLETDFPFRPTPEVSYTEFSRIVQSGRVERGLIVLKPLVLIPGLKGLVKTKDGAVVGADLSQTGMTSWSDTLAGSGIKVYNKMVFPGDFIAFQVSPFLLFIMVFVLLSQSAGVRGFSDFLKNKAKRLLQQRVTFNDVAGLDGPIKELKEDISILRSSKTYASFDVKCPKGFILQGPPGCGKTLLAKAVAGEAGVPYFLISAAEIGGVLVGRGAIQIKDVFEQARAAKKAVIIFDEFETLGGRRRMALFEEGEDRTQTTNQLLAEMDGINTGEEEIIVIACTNQFNRIDEAILRPGRFGRHFFIGPPDQKGRKAILKVHTRNKPLASNVDLEKIAKLTPGFSGAQLADLVNLAAKRAARKYSDNLAGQVIAKLAPREITMADFYEAISEALMGTAKDLNLSPREKEIIAVHESGHATVGRVVLPHRPIRRMVIVPHEKALGYVWAPAEREKYLRFIEEIKAELSWILAGREAEASVFKTFSDGSKEDRISATRIAKDLVWQVMNLQYFDEEDFKPDEATRAKLNERIEQILEKAARVTREILTHEAIKPVFQELKDAILRSEGGELEEEELEKIFSKIPQEVIERFQNFDVPE